MFSLLFFMSAHSVNIYRYYILCLKKINKKIKYMTNAMNSVAPFYPVLQQILRLQPPARQSRHVFSHIISFLPTWCGVISVNFFWELSNIWQICVCVDLEMKCLVWLCTSTGENINFLKNQQFSFLNMKMYCFCGCNMCPQNF